MTPLDDIDRALLNRLQAGFPLVDDPYAALGRDVGIGRDEAFARVTALRRTVIRRIGAVIDTRGVGRVSTLVGAGTGGDFESLVRRLEGMPEVTHAYHRGGEPDFWFTLTAETPGRLAARLEELTAAFPRISFRRFDARRVFKIGVRLDVAHP